MVMVEAMACGTPVVALARGSVPEVVEHGRTGVVVDDPEELAGAIERANGLDPADCRRRAETMFGTEAMTCGYEEVYRSLVAPDDGPVLPARLSGRRRRPRTWVRWAGSRCRSGR